MTSSDGDRTRRALRGTILSDSVALLLLGLLAGTALLRTVVAFEIDALTIAVLSALLTWTQYNERRRARATAEKIEYLLIRQRYGPLTAEDVEAILALKSQHRRLARRRAS